MAHGLLKRKESVVAVVVVAGVLIVVGVGVVVAVVHFRLSSSGRVSVLDVVVVRSFRPWFRRPRLMFSWTH